MGDNTDTDRHLLPIDSIKLMGESIGISTLNDDAAVKLSEDLEYRLKEIIQDAKKFTRHSKRKKLVSTDIDLALKVKNVEPLYGFDTAEYIPFRHTSGGGKDLYYPDDQEVGLLDIVNSPLPRLPCDVTVRAHWLSVEGVQPAVPENPAPATNEEQYNEATGSNLPSVNFGDPISHLKKIQFDRKGKKKDENIGTEWSKLKPLQAHALSNEQQLYYREITDACVGIGSEAKWQEALNSLSTDPGIYQLMPQFTSFINEGIKVNIGQRKLIVLKHLVKMIGALLENSSLTLEKYLHELIPSLITCLIAKQLCARPESEDHWSLRDSVAKILAKICKKYSNSINNIQPRITREFSKTLSNTDQGLAAHYGIMSCLIEMGPDTITSLVIPHLKQESVPLRLALGQPAKTAEHAAASKLQSLLLRHCAPLILTSRPVGDTVAQYQADYGGLGQALFNQVKSLRQNRSSVTARVSSPTSKPVTLSVFKNKPPPLTFSQSQVLALRTNPVSKTRSPSVSTPTLAAALQLVSQAAKSNPATPTSTTTPSGTALSATLLSAVISNPGAHAALTEQLNAVLSNAGGNNGNSSHTSTPSPVVQTSAAAVKSPSSPKS